MEGRREEPVLAQRVVPAGVDVLPLLRAVMPLSVIGGAVSSRLFTPARTRRVVGDVPDRGEVEVIPRIDIRPHRPRPEPS